MDGGGIVARSFVDCARVISTMAHCHIVAVSHACEAAIGVCCAGGDLAMICRYVHGRETSQHRSCNGEHEN